MLAMQCVSQAPAPSTPAPKKQQAADVRAYRAALNTPDPNSRLVALRAFVKDYPDSKSADKALDKMLDVLLEHFPERVADIDSLARQQVKDADKGSSRWRQQMYVADALAGAGPSGVDLPLAESWIQDTARHLTEARFLEDEKKQYAEANAELPSPEDRHKQYQHLHAEILLVTAHVAFKQGKLAEATSALDQAAALEPLNDELNYLRGEIAMQQHRPDEALVDYERAQLLGALPDPQRKQMLSLYREAHGGSLASLEDDLDKRYSTLYPAAFQPAEHPRVEGGHTALLELFTGSACPPCVGGDLAVETVLEKYPRSEVVALAFDQHIPGPDPLANPSSVERAGVFGVGSTPSYILDGKRLPLFGSTRADAERLYKNLVKALDAQLARPSGVQLQLASTRAADGALQASLTVQLEPEPALLAKTAQETATEVASTADDATAAKKPSGPSPTGTVPADASATRAQQSASAPASAVPQLAVYFALVEDQVRYSGENGVRFHRMVVRCVKRATNTALKPGDTATAQVSFDPEKVSQANAEYLKSYEKENDRFGPFDFLSRETGMQPGHLAVAAWVQDVATHRVLQATFTPLVSAGTERAERSIR